MADEKKKKVKKKKMKTHKKSPNWIFVIIRIILTPILWIKYRMKFDKSTSKGIKRPCLILSNHQTGIDQFAVGMGFKFAMNYVASDTIFRHGFTSWLMRVLTRPIPFSKGTGDPTAVKSMMQVVAAGGSVGIFCEGNRCYYGETMQVQPGTGKLAKKLNVPVILCNINGGYLTKPRWKKRPNKGICDVRVVRVITVEELAELSGDEIQDIIQKTLYVNEFEFAMQHKVPYKGKARAEFLEGLLFYCPKCGQMGGLSSKKHNVFCAKCNLVATINPHIHFEYDAESVGLPLTILDWSKLQEKFVEEFDVSPYTDKSIFEDVNATFSKVEYAKKQTGGMLGILKMYNDRLNICNQDFYFDTLKAVTVTESRKLSFFTTDGTAYAVDVPRKTNVIKYKLFFEKIIKEEK